MVEALENVAETDANDYINTDQAGIALAEAGILAAVRTRDESRYNEEARNSFATSRDDIDAAVYSMVAAKGS